MRVDWRLTAAIALILAWVSSPISGGYTSPLNTATLPDFAGSVVLFASYLYFMRTLFRLPFAVRMAIRRYRHARRHYNLEQSAALFDSYYRGFLDRRRWATGPLAIIDRLVAVGIVLVACTPSGGLWVSLGGTLGVITLLITYIYSGRFALLLDDGAPDGGGLLRDVPSLRRPQDNVF